MNQTSLAQFYTESNLSKLLVGQLKTRSPRLVLDLGAGNGSLTVEAARRWKNANFLTADIVPSKLILDGVDSQRHRHFVFDVLTSDIQDRFSIKPEDIDVSLCNPPYTTLIWQDRFSKILEESGLSGAIPCIRNTSSDVLFLAQNLKYLKKGGELGIIVPDGLITGERLAAVRKDLVEKNKVTSVIQLPPNIFRKTEARTYLLIVKKGIRSSKPIPLAKMNTEGKIDSYIHIDKLDARSRLDYEYYKSIKSRNKTIKILKTPSTIDVRRGSLNWTACKKQNIRCFHTTHFSNVINPEKYIVPRALSINSKTPNNSCTAKSGDILVARVGRNLHTQMVYVKSGEMLITDCIFRIRTEKANAQRIWKFLSSINGRNWLKNETRGVCARYISKSSLLRVPLSIQRKK